MASPHRNIFMWQATHLSCRKAAIRQTARKMAVTRPMLIFCFCKEPRECKLFEISRKNVIIQGKIAKIRLTEDSDWLAETGWCEPFREFFNADYKITNWGRRFNVEIWKQSSIPNLVRVILRTDLNSLNVHISISKKREAKTTSPNKDWEAW